MSKSFKAIGGLDPKIAKSSKLFSLLNPEVGLVLGFRLGRSKNYGV